MYFYVLLFLPLLMFLFNFTFLIHTIKDKQSVRETKSSKSRMVEKLRGPENEIQLNFITYRHYGPIKSIQPRGRYNPWKAVLILGNEETRWLL